VAIHSKLPAEGMVERRGHSLWFTHLLMIIGVLIVFFPIWLQTRFVLWCRCAGNDDVGQFINNGCGHSRW